MIKLTRPRWISENWLEIGTKHYSTLALILLNIVLLLPYISWYGFGYQINPEYPYLWACVLAPAGLVGKFLIQVDEGRWVRRGLLGGVLIWALFASQPAFASTHSCPPDDCDPLVEARSGIKLWESTIKRGDLHLVYLDRIPNPDVPTGCWGLTRDNEGRPLRVGDLLTDAQCDAMLDRQIPIYRNGVQSAMTDETKANRLTCHRDAAFTEWTWNIGPRAAQRSTAIRRINKGDIRGSCEAMAWFNKSGGVIIAGLVNRRSYEKEKCLRGLG